MPFLDFHSSSTSPRTRTGAAATTSVPATTAPAPRPTDEGTTPTTDRFASTFAARAGTAAPVAPATSVASGLNALRVRLSPDVALPRSYSLPERVPLGAATIHRYDDPRVSPPTIAVTVWAPLPPTGSAARVQDLNAARTTDRLPDRFVVTDAGLTRCFIGVDKRPGTALDRKLDALVAQIPKNARGEVEADAAVDWVRTHVNQLVRWTPGSSANDGRAEFAWDKAIDVPDTVWSTFKDVAYEPVGHAPAPASVDYPVVPFERYLDAGQGYCIQKALLAALILDKVGVPSKLVNGAVAQGPGRTVGHTWLELGDGRVLDAAWSQVERKGQAPADFPDRFRFGGSDRFANATFPFLVFDDG